DDIISRYFTNDAGTFYVRKRVRSMIVFGEHDLARRAPFPRIDLVMCRNVLIYFTAQLQEYVLRSFAYSIQDRGRLILGKAETTAPLSEYFEPEESKLRVYRRRGERIVMPAALTNPSAQLFTPPARLPEWMSTRLPSNRHTATMAPPAPNLASNDFLLSFPLGIVIIDRSYDVHAINAAARSLLSIHTAAIGEDLIHLARHLQYDETREVIDSAFRDGAHRIITELSVDDAVTGEPRFLKLTCYPIGDQKPTKFVSIIIDDVSDAAQERQTLSRRLEEVQAERDRISRSASEQVARIQADVAIEHAGLQRQVERVRGINHEITDANRNLTQLVEEMRVRNEELMLMTEESQAANEEVETLNEELQATNEELETLNEELQATVEELNTTNEELQSRGNEMQELARTHEGERAHLETILRSMTDAVIAFDRAGRSILANEAARPMFGTSSGEEGWLEHSILLDPTGRELTTEEMPRNLASRGERFKTEFTVLMEEGSHRFFEATGGPIEIGGKIEGGVVVVRDITDRSLRILQDEFLALASHELRNPLTVVQSYLQLLLRQLNNHPDDIAALRSRADIALSQTHQLNRLIGDLISTTRLQNGKYQLDLEPVRLDNLVASTVEQAKPLAQGQRIEFQSDGPVTVAADAGRLEQVVLNLLRNAITYAPNTECIDVRVNRVDGCALIEVIDQGMGISAIDLPHLFTRFYQVKRQDRPARGGLGLGLFISKQIVDAHSGRIEVSSTEGEGATFRIFLPTIEPEDADDTQ
ncbi:MAG TPA: ATP-binding protein, partial [Nitrolancea sp.]|nr:ATP-binding protein [Nitrolancea sp.]